MTPPRFTRSLTPQLALLALGCGGDSCARLRLLPFDGVPVAVCAEVAATERARAIGLRGRPPLTRDAALLLWWDRDVAPCITTRSLVAPIDVVFVTAEGDVPEVACHRGPEDADICRNGVRGVLELAPRDGCEGWARGRLEGLP